MCYDTATPSVDTIVQAHLPLVEGRGPTQPLNNYKDVILDLKVIDAPTRMLLSSGRDGEIKLFK